MTHDDANTIAYGLARMRRRIDLGLRFIGGPLGNPAWLRPRGALLLRRWSGKKHPQPVFGVTVGYADRPATSVSAIAGATYSNDTVYWQRVDTVSAGGVVTAMSPEMAQPVVWGPSGYVGAIPNMPLHVRAIPLASGAVRLVWCFSTHDQQAEAASFDIFSDGGTGAMDWTTIVDSVAVEAGTDWYAWDSGVLAAGMHLFNVRAKTAGGVYSLAPDVADTHRGGLGSYAPVGGGSGVRVNAMTTAPAAPPAPVF